MTGGTGPLATESYVIRGGKLGYERLAVLGRAWWPTTSALLDRVGLAPGMSCLDLGCGGGELTLELARRVGPEAVAVGVDMDEIKLDLARESALAQGLSNVEFRVEAYQRVLERHGGDPLSGRKLHRYFAEAAVPAPELSVVQRVDRTGEAKGLPHSTIEATADAIVREGIATAEEVRTALTALLDFAVDPGYVCGSPRLCQAWTRRTVG